MMKLSIKPVESMPPPAFPPPVSSPVEIWRDHAGSVYAYGQIVGEECWMHLPGLASFRFTADDDEVAAAVTSDAEEDLVLDAYRRRVLPMAQVVEYLRAFLFGRLGWAPLNAVPVVSGTFGVFRAESVVAAGGYRQDTVGEDMELVMRLHRLNRIAGKPYRISFLLSPVAWKSAPASTAALRDQRIRWQRGLGESLSRNRELLFHRRGGAPGWLMMPFMVTFELLGPLIELSGYLFMLIGVLCGFVSPPVFWSFLLLVVSLGVLLSISALLLEEVSCHIYVRRGNLFALVCMAIIENFGYHQLVLWWRLQGIYQWATRSVTR